MAYEVGTDFAVDIGYRCKPRRTEDIARVENLKKWTLDSHYKKDTNKGEAVPEELFPQQVKFVKGKKLFDYNGYVENCRCVSQKFKDIVESFEPGQHQFVPVEVYHKDGTLYLGSFYYFVITHLIDSIDGTKGGIKLLGDIPPFGKLFTLDRASGITPSVQATIIDNRCAWYELRMSQQPFFSQKLVEELQRQKIKGVDYITHWNEI